MDPKTSSEWEDVDKDTSDSENDTEEETEMPAEPQYESNKPDESVFEPQPEDEIDHIREVELESQPTSESQPVAQSKNAPEWPSHDTIRKELEMTTEKFRAKSFKIGKARLKARETKAAAERAKEEGVTNYSKLAHEAALAQEQLDAINEHLWCGTFFKHLENRMSLGKTLARPPTDPNLKEEFWKNFQDSPTQADLDWYMMAQNLFQVVFSTRDFEYEDELSGIKWYLCKNKKEVCSTHCFCEFMF